MVTHQLLHKSSFHPKDTFAGILNSQITRFYRNCSEISEFENACPILFKAPKSRRHAKRFLRSIKKQALAHLTRRSENDNTPQPLDPWTNSPFIGQQVRNCKRFALTHYVANLFAMHRGPRSIPLCIHHHIQLTSLSFQVSRPSHS